MTTRLITFDAAVAADAADLATLRVEAMRASLLRVGRFDAVRAWSRVLDRSADVAPGPVRDGALERVRIDPISIAEVQSRHQGRDQMG